MPVDVETEVGIDCPRDEVARYAADPDNATAWYAPTGFGVAEISLSASNIIGWDA